MLWKKRIRVSATILRLPDVRALHGWAAGRQADSRQLPDRQSDGLPHGADCDQSRTGSVVPGGPHDDTVFPRLGAPDGDDVLAREPMTGERDIRIRRPASFCSDAICAATDKLVITYAGTNEHSGQQRPRLSHAVELLDAPGRPVARTGRAPGRRDQVLIKHPQPFDIRNVTPGALGEPASPSPFFGHRSGYRYGPRRATRFLACRCLPLPPDDITLAELRSSSPIR